MRKIIYLLTILFLASFSSALIMEEGSMLNHDDVYYEFMNDIEFEEVQVLSDRIIFNGEHELKFVINSGELYIKIYSWDGLNHNFSISSSTNQVVQYDIFVNESEYFFKSGNELYKDSISVTTAETFWIYTLEEPEPPRRGGGGGEEIPREDEVEDEVVESAFNPVQWLREKYDSLSQEDINFLTFLLILLIFMILITRRKKDDAESWSVNYRG